MVDLGGRFAIAHISMQAPSRVGALGTLFVLLHGFAFWCDIGVSCGTHILLATSVFG